MMRLNLPKYSFRIKSKENKLYIFDPIRKKSVVLTDEEWVRQHFLSYLMQEKKYPPSLIAVERQCLVNGLRKRTDIIVFNRKGSPHILVECKAPGIPVNREVFDQVARYNMSLEADFLILTNGMHHVFCRMDHVNQRYEFLTELPEYG